MAHFARLNEHNIVEEVVVISNNDILDENGNESETVGIAFCEQLFGIDGWIQTSYNHKFRRQYAGIGYTYDPAADVFIAPQPASWYVLDENYDWIVPLGVKPHNGEIVTDVEWQWLELVFAIEPQYP